MSSSPAPLGDLIYRNVDGWTFDAKFDQTYVSRDLSSTTERWTKVNERNLLYANQTTKSLSRSFMQLVCMYVCTCVGLKLEIIIIKISAVHYELSSTLGINRIKHGASGGYCLRAFVCVS